MRWILSRGAHAALGVLILVCWALVCNVGPAAAAAPTDAVVLVSGITTTTPFTTPSSVCTGTNPRGSTWSYDGAKFAADGFRVYTAPVNYGAGGVAPDPPKFSNCPAQLPASMTINSKGDIYANARALASFIAYLHSQFGVNTVRFVAHSYGGLWTRGAMRLAASDFPSVQVQSMTTLGTPHLGSFMADIGEGVDPSVCGSDLACKAIAYLLIASRETYYEPALSQVTATAVAQWNARQGTSLDGIPLNAIGGNAISIKGESAPTSRQTMCLSASRALRLLVFKPPGPFLTSRAFRPSPTSTATPSCRSSRP